MSLQTRGLLGAVLILGSLAAFLALQYGGDLMRDVGVRGQQLVPQSQLRVTEADCTRYYFIVSACTIGYTEVRAPQQHMMLKENRGQLKYFVFGSLAGERITLLRPAGQPDLVTTEVGMRYLARRILTLTMLIGLATILAIVMAFRMLFPSKRHAEWNNPARIDEAIAAGAHEHARTVNPTSPPNGLAANASPAAFGRRSLAP